MIIATCNLNQLVQLESILFATEWDVDPHIPTFYIQCENEIYKYQIIKTFGKYRIVTC